MMNHGLSWSRRAFFPVVAALVLGLQLLATPVAHSATWTVINNGDSGPGSLRQAISDAAPNDTINFADDFTITLSAQLLITKNLTIDGTGRTVAISGGGITRTLNITSGINAALTNLTLMSGQLLMDDPFGGGVSNSGALTLTDCRFSGNTASGGGGAIFNAGTLTVTNCSFVNNAVQGGPMGAGGGAIANIGTATVVGSYFHWNLVHATIINLGAAIINQGVLTVTNSTFAANTAAMPGSMGGGIHNTGTLTVTSSTFAENQAKFGGGGISNTGSATIKNTIIANSVDAGNCSGNAFAAGSTHNLADDATCSGGFTQSSSLLLGTVGDYGGSSATVPLLPGSAAIEAGDPSCPPQDQRGVARVGTCDIGAFESQGFTLTPIGGNNQSTPVNTAFASPLQLSVTAIGTVEPVNGGRVTFTAPEGGASAVFADNAVAIVAGSVSVAATANSTAGSYQVTSSASGAVPVMFNLTNLPPGSWNYLPFIRK